MTAVMYSLNVLYVHHPQQRPIIDSKLLMAFFPYQLTYAVVEIDMEKTLQALNDPIANVAAGSTDAHSNMPDIFNEDFLPILKVWHDVGAQFSEEDVPDPMQFLKQYDEVVGYASANLGPEA